MSTQNKRKITAFEIAVYPMLGALMFCSKIMLEFLPNIHLLGMFTMAYTLAFGIRALIPIYIYIFINGIYAGFNMWWYPYLYLWTILWGVTMLLPKNMPDKKARILYPIVCSLHGLLFGTLYAPAQAVMFHLGFKGMIAWIIAGLPWDAVHAVGNLAAGCLVLPVSKLLKKLMRERGIPDRQ